MTHRIHTLVHTSHTCESPDKPWRVKAHRLIDDFCRASYLHANTAPSGKLYKRHRPYSVPEDAEFLIACLDKDNEEAAKDRFNMLAFR